MKRVLSILTYNIWFGDPILENSSFPTDNERFRGIIKLLLKFKPDIICLQEVTQEAFHLLFANKRLQKLYNFNIQYFRRTYGELILCKYKIVDSKIIKFNNTMMDRDLNLIKIKVNNIDTNIITAHLESVFSNYHSHIKINQYKHILTKFKNTKNSIFVGDTNLLNHEESKINSLTKKYNWNDGWIKDGSKLNKKYSYDYKYNMYVKMKNKKHQSRFDRVIYKTDNLILKSFDFIGKKKLIEKYNNKYQLSDHFGILTKFRIVKAKSKTNTIKERRQRCRDKNLIYDVKTQKCRPRKRNRKITKI